MVSLEKDGGGQKQRLREEKTGKDKRESEKKNIERLKENKTLKTV